MRERLYRSQRARVVAGVAGGLAQYFNIDPIIMRIVFVVLTIMHGIGPVIYIILWIAVPEEPFAQAYGLNVDPKPSGEPTAEGAQEQTAQNFSFANFPEEKSSGKGRIIAGTILIVIGAVFFIDRFVPSFDFDDVFPFVFILAGAALLLNSVKK